MIKRFFSFYKPYKKLFAIDIICSFLVAVCNLFYPFAAQKIINNFVPDNNLKFIIIWCAVLLLIYVIKALLTFVVQFWGHVLGVKIQGDMRETFFNHIELLPFTYFDNNKTGSIMSRLTNDLFDVSELAHHGPEDTFISVISIIGAMIMLCVTVNPWLALISFAIVPFMMLFAIKARLNLRLAFKRSREEMAEINAGIESSVSGIRVAKAYTADKKECEKFAVTNKRFKEARASSYKAMGVFFSGMGFFNDILYLVALFAGGLFYYFKLITIGEFTSYILYTTMMINPLRTLVNIFEQIQNGMTGFGRFCEVMDIEEEKDCENPVEIDRLKGNIRFENVTFSYINENDAKVIKDLSLSVDSGKTIALVGPSGGGKTTFCHLIPRFYEISSGKITIDGTDIRDMRRRDLRKNIGIVAQDVFLFNGSIRDNIMYGNLSATQEEMIEAAKNANIHDYVQMLPNGYDTQVGERGVKLSGGQKQRISIARAFLKNPPILILDEATSALDNVTESQIQESLERLSEGRTTIVVAHRLTTIKNADEIIVIDSGGISERGTHQELMDKNGVYAELHKIKG